MKNYIYDSITVSSGFSQACIMAALIANGWKNLQYVSHSSHGDCRWPEITGVRPMTKDELKEKDDMLKKEQKQDLKELRKLAKKLGYIITKE